MSGANIANFYGYETIPLNAGASSLSVSFKEAGSISDMSDVLVTNTGNVTAFVAFGNSKGGTVAITAQTPGTNGTTGATPILAGKSRVFNKNANAAAGGADTCAGITVTGSAQLYFTSGRGS